MVIIANLTSRSICVLTFAIVIMLTGSLPATSHSGATGIVKTRMETMKDIAANTKILGEIIKGNAAYDASTVSNAAGSIAVHAAKIRKLFPEGSNPHPSEALPAIWQEFEAFMEKAGRLAAAASTMKNQADSGNGADTFNQSFRNLASTCQSCHESYRLKKQ